MENKANLRISIRVSCNQLGAFLVVTVDANFGDGLQFNFMGCSYFSDLCFTCFEDFINSMQYISVHADTFVNII